MTISDVTTEFSNLDLDFRQVPNRDTARNHELAIIKKFLQDLSTGDSNESKVASYILSSLRFVY